MAIWNIDTFDSVADSVRTKFTAPYVEGLPQGVVRNGPQANPHEGTASILGTYRSGANNTSGQNKYMHYCTRMLRWNDIDLTDIPNIGTRNTCHKTSRFGDLEDLLGKGNQAGSAGAVEEVSSPPSSYNINNEMARYRFNPITRVKYYQYTRKGMRYSQEFIGGTVFTGHPYQGLTCGWSPGPADDSFHWNPNSTELTQISTDIASDLATKGTTLAKLQALDYTWNLCVIAWCWAGYRRAGNFGAGDKTYQGYHPGRTGSRDIDEVDIYYFPFIF
jgi:hypothetical protein